MLLVPVGREAMPALRILAYVALANVTCRRIAFAKVIARSVGK